MESNSPADGETSALNLIRKQVRILANGFSKRAMCIGGTGEAWLSHNTCSQAGKKPKLPESAVRDHDWEAVQCSRQSFTAPDVGESELKHEA